MLLQPEPLIFETIRSGAKSVHTPRFGCAGCALSGKLYS